jgi:pimeloyl-ACP methyl ester carboxylesterase
MRVSVVRAVMVALIAAGAAAITEASFADDIVKPVLRPQHGAAPVTPLAKTDVPQPLPPPTGPVQQYAYGRIILMRGLMNIFSRGMDTLETELKQRGLPVKIYNHTAWNPTADAMIEEYKTNKSMLPIIIVGHSLGADASLIMSNYLAEHGVPVSLVITFDGVVEPALATNGNAEIINYYKPNAFGQEVKPTRGFRGKITNIDLTDHPEIEHLNIDKIPSLHEDTIAKILEVMKKKPAPVKASVAAKG